MPDDLFLTSPAGSVLNIGTWLESQPRSVDYGAKDLRRFVYAEHPAVEGGRLAYEWAPHRSMAFPLILASGGAGLSLAQLESLIRLYAVPGGWLDIRLDGVASSDAVRFDILDGRYEHDYHVMYNRAGIRTAWLKLDTPPFGYSPTWITLGSAASVGLPGFLALSPPANSGDIPGLVQITVQPVISTQFPAGAWIPDNVIWSLGARFGFQAFFAQNSMSGVASVADSFVPLQSAAAAGLATMAANPAAWTNIIALPFNKTLEPSFRGRHRVYGLFNLTPSQALPWQLLVDVQAGLNTFAISNQAMASANPVATLPPAVASGTPGGFGAQASPAYTLLDFGEITVPPGGSGLSQDFTLRVWAGAPTSNPGVAAQIRVAGLYLQPLDGGAGILPRGLVQPSILGGTYGRFFISAQERQALVALPTGDLATTYPIANAWQFYRGDLPYMGASTAQLDLMGAARTTASGATGPLVYAGYESAAASLQYRPRFQFIKGL